MASLFKRIFKSEVVVEFTKDKISLKTDEKAVEFEPILFVSPDPQNRRPLGFESHFVPREASIRIEPMKPGDLPVAALSKDVCLAAILRHNLRGLLSPLALILPKFIVYGWESLAEPLKASDQKEISQFLMSIGAREVVLKK